MIDQTYHECEAAVATAMRALPDATLVSLAARGGHTDARIAAGNAAEDRRIRLRASNALRDALLTGNSAEIRKAAEDALRQGVSKEEIRTIATEHAKR